MDALLHPSPGLIIWTLINFGIFFIIIGKFGLKPMLNAVREREESIQRSIEDADRINADAQALLKQSQEKLASAQSEMMAIVREGKSRAEANFAAALEEAEKMKREKIAEAQREIEREKDSAIASLKTEVATLVIQATGKVLGSSLNGEKHKELVDTYVSQISKN